MIISAKKIKDKVSCIPDAGSKLAGGDSPIHWSLCTDFSLFGSEKRKKMIDLSCTHRISIDKKGVLILHLVLIGAVILACIGCKIKKMCRKKHKCKL